MTYIIDGSDISYDADLDMRARLNDQTLYYSWGWLGNSVPAVWDNAGDKAEFLNELRDSKFEEATKYLGHHVCEICGVRKDDNTSNGSLPFKANGKTYIAPAGVLHYIEEHNYKPPDEVIDVVINQI